MKSSVAPQSPHVGRLKLTLLLSFQYLVNIREYVTQTIVPCIMMYSSRMSTGVYLRLVSRIPPKETVHAQLHDRI